MTADTTLHAAAAARATLVQALVDEGAITPQWRAAFEAVPRHLFVPFFYDGAGVRIAGDDPGTADSWFTAVHQNRSLVTHRTDGAATSSSTEPSLMARMLDALDVADTSRVLEIGTGTGYNAALLSHRVGDSNVTTLDLDEDITGPARERLTQAGYAPLVVTSDGASGWPTAKPYDRIIATCSLDTVPRPLLAQLADGGVMVAPLRNGLTRIERTRAGATGRFIGGAFFMTMRHQGGTTGVTRRPALPDGPARASALPTEAIVNSDFRFFLSLVVPRLTWRYDAIEQGIPRGVQVWTADGSIASLSTEGSVRETNGLWTLLEHAHTSWAEAERPGLTRYGITVDDQDQHIWLNSPTGPSWRLA
ncbi:methyltransferase domain-containing protein [Streptomyces laurentii]|uniref:methyltransferase domain-containing protein n=1 Tax=Streptomyces laurentii TaxID=39478 RepID=UPI00367DA86A